MKWTIHRLAVDVASAGQRLDQYLAAACADISRTSAKKIIDLGGVHVDGRRVRGCSRIVNSGQQVEVYLDQMSLEPYRLVEADIVYQDAYIIVVNKPSCIETQPTHARFKGTLYEALQVHLQDPFRLHLKPELGMVQRLDRGTSGLMVFSIHQKAHKKLTQIFVDHQVEKRYFALVAGIPAAVDGEIRSLLARSRKQNRVHTVEKGGKQAITRYRVAEAFNANALLDVELLTGRSHQIRAHMSEQHWPLLGDPLYGGPESCMALRLDRPMLHAAKLAFHHPVTDKFLEFSAELPNDFFQLLQKLRLTPGKGS